MTVGRPQENLRPMRLRLIGEDDYQARLEQVHAELDRARAEVRRLKSDCAALEDLVAKLLDRNEVDLAEATATGAQRLLGAGMEFGEALDLAEALVEDIRPALRNEFTHTLAKDLVAERDRLRAIVKRQESARDMFSRRSSGRESFRIGREPFRMED